MANNVEHIFVTELNGYKKKQVDDFITNMQSNYEGEIQSLEEYKKKLEEEVAALKAENSDYKEQLQFAIQGIEKKHKETEELKKKVKEASIDYERVARILVDAEKQADDLKKKAIADMAGERARASAECQDLKENIRTMISDIQTMEESTRQSTRSLFAILEEQIKAFEENVEQKISASAQAMNEYAALKISEIDEINVPADALEYDPNDMPLEETSAGFSEAEAVLDDAVTEEAVSEEPNGSEETADTSAEETAETPVITDITEDFQENNEAAAEDDIALVIEGENKADAQEDYSFALSDEAKSFFEEEN